MNLPFPESYLCMCHNHPCVRSWNSSIAVSYLARDEDSRLCLSLKDCLWCLFLRSHATEDGVLDCGAPASRSLLSCSVPLCLSLPGCHWGISDLAFFFFLVLGFSLSSSPLFFIFLFSLSFLSLHPSFYLGLFISALDSLPTMSDRGISWE